MRLLALFLAASALAVASPADAGRSKPQGPTSLEDRMTAWDRHQQLEQESLFAGLPWRCVGPVIQGGRLVDIEVSPDHPYTFYAAYASGGLWRTTNNGMTFEPLTDDLPVMILADIAIDPNDPDTLWIGTGENNSSRSSYGGMGVYKSTDRGETWTYLGLGDTDRIGRIVIDPRDSDRVLVSALGRLYTESGDRGIYLTEDGGATWTTVLEGDSYTGFVDMVQDPSDPDVVYAAAWERSRSSWDFVEGGEGSGLWKSTDFGRTWTQLEGGFPSGEHVGRIGLSVSASDPDIVYAYVDNQELLPEDQWDLGDGAVTPKRLRNMTKEEFLRQDPEEIEDFVRGYDLDPSLDSGGLVEKLKNDEITLQEILDSLSDANANLFNTDIRGAQVWRSEDAGATWSLTHPDPIRQLGYTYGYYFGQIRVSPTDPDRVFIMGVPMLRSDDGGQTWEGIDKGRFHVDHQAMWIDPEHHDRLLVGNDGGLAMSYDGGGSWLVLNSIPVGQFYTVSVDMAEPYNIYGGMQDNGTYMGSSQHDLNDDRHWRRISGGDGMYVQIDPRDNQTKYVGYQFGFYNRIDADGSWHRARPRHDMGEEPLRYNWQTPILLSTHNSDILYFGANKLFRSMDQGETWTALSDDLTRSKNRGNVPFGTITTIDESKFHFGLLWAGTDDGQIWLTEDGGASWEMRDDKLPRDRWVSRVEASEHERNVAHLSLNGYRDDDMTAYVYRTEDLGKTWKDISDGLPEEPVNVIREDPENPDILYVGTDRGAYISLDQGGTWSALQGGLPNVPVHDMVIHPRDKELVAGTHGRSVWVVDVAPIQELDDEIRAAGIHLYDTDEIDARRGWRGRRSMWFHRPEFDPTHRFTYWTPEAGDVTVEILDEDDRVLRRWEVEALAGMNVVDWDLRLDADLALPAEAERLAEEESEADDEDSDVGALAKTPWSEAVRLGRPLYVTAGAYTVRVTRGDASATTDLTVNAPPAREPRATAPAVRPSRIGP